MEDRVHNELSQFLSIHALEECISNIDEIVLAYLVGVVELASQGDDGTDFEDVLDMMNAYLPGFEKIDRSDVIQWMFGLADKLASKEIVTDGVSLEQPVEPHTRAMPVTDNVPNGDCESQLHSMTQRRTFPLYDFSNSVAISGQQTTVKSLSHSCRIASDHQPSNLNGDKWEGTVSPQMKDKSTEDGQRLQRHPNSKPNNFHSDSFNEKKSRSKRKSRQLSCSSQESQEDSAVIEETDSPETEPQICALLEMFPSACSMEARHCLRLAGGDLDRAAQLVLDRQESGQAIAAGGNVTTKKKNHKAKKGTCFKLDDDSIKLSVLKKYSFVDTEEDKRTYRPPPPKGEAKKLVRYRDGQIVSMKGERFSEIKKNTNEMKS